MDETPRKTNSANSADNAPENLGEIFANDSYVKPELETAQSCNRHHKAKNKEDRWYRLLAKHLGNQAKEAGLHDWLIVFFTAVLTLVACLQGCLVYKNSSESSMQMGHAIDAANRIDDAADSFAHSASKIDGGIHDAVGKLNLQATAIDDANGIARTSLEQTKKALRVSRERFNQDERPVVLISNITPSLPNGGQPYQVLFDKINFGKSPAIHFSSQAVLFVGADSLAQVYNWFLHVQGPEKGITGPKSTIPQGVFSNLSDRHSGTVSTLTPLSKDEAYQVLMGHYYALGGRMWYQDIAGNEYQTDFCLIGTTLADTAFCPIHNDIK